MNRNIGNTRRYRKSVPHRRGDEPIELATGQENTGVGSQHLTFHKKHSKEGDKAGPSVFQFLSNPFRAGS